MIEEKKFEAESKELLSLMINSIYSNKEVFLRELISNGSDAIDKYKILALQSEGKYPLKNYEIRIDRNKDERYIQVQDNGVGMSKEDLEHNLGTIARSGTKEFLEKAKEQQEKSEDVDLIGQFGVGFYSAFMVAKEVKVYSRDLQGSCHVFSSDGVEKYTIEDLTDIDFLPDSGTAIRVYLKDDSEDENYSRYLEDYEIEDLVKKYSDFIRYPIKMIETKEVTDKDENGEEIENSKHEVKEDKTLNSMVPLWKKSKKDVTDEDLSHFYKNRFDDYEDPLLSLNIKAEGTLEYNALVFIPAHAPYNLYSQDYEKGLALYAKGVFISEKNKDLVPDYLRFVRGLVDSEDLQLNISREMLQKSPILRKVAVNIENKVVERLKQLKDEDFEKYLKFFKVYGDFIKFGIYSSYGGKKDQLQDLLVYNSLLSEKMISLKEYKDKMKEGQKCIYYATGKTIEAIKLLPQLNRYQKEEIDVLLLTANIDEFTLNMMNSYSDLTFKNIASEDKESLSDEDKEKIKDLETENRRLLDDLKTALGDKVDEVSFSLSLGDAPVSVSSRDSLSLNMEQVLNEEAKNLKEDDRQVNVKKVMLLNPEHDLFKAIQGVTSEEEVNAIASLLYDEAMILEGYEITDKAEFFKNLNAVLVKAYQK